MSVPTLIEEKRAGDKVCPQALARTYSFDSDTRCIGSLCMAWRFSFTQILKDSTVLVPSEDTHGYCGLAGFPGTYTTGA